MKKLPIILTLIVITLLTFGCGEKQDDTQDAGYVQMGNPWKDYENLAEAENAAGFSLSIPESVENYTADTFRVLNGELLEVRFSDGENTVTVRKQAGEDQDISGDYTQYPTVSLTDADGYSVESRTDGSVTSAIISSGGFSWSVYSPSDMADSFINAVLGAK